MSYALIVIIAIFFLYKSKAIVKFLNERLQIRIRLLSYVCLIVACAIITSGAIAYYNMNHKPNKSSLNSSSPRPAIKNNIYYILDGDTIAELLSVENSASNIWTRRKYGKDEDILVQTIVNKLLPGQDNLTHFLFTEKIVDENYYASFNNGKLRFKYTPEQMIANIKEEMRTSIIHSDLDFVNIFFAKLDKFKDNIKSLDTDGTLRKGLIEFQKKNFPKARSEYYKHVKNALWEKNIEVKLEGKNITYIGYMFVDNKVIKDTYEEVLPDLVKLRFKRVSFKWAEGVKYTYWDIDSKDDKDI